MTNYYIRFSGENVGVQPCFDADVPWKFRGVVGRSLVTDLKWEQTAPTEELGRRYGKSIAAELT